MGAVAVPCPIRRSEIGGLTKEKRKVTADMHQRIRERLPHLDAVIVAAEDHRRSSAELLERASETAIGERFEHAALNYRRVPRYAKERTARHMVARSYRPTDGHRRTTCTTRGEDDAFWCWAVVETLRHTGIRAEELVDEDGAIIRTCRSAASQPQTGATGGQTMRRRRR